MALSPIPSEEVRARYECLGDDGTRLTVVEYRYLLHRTTPAGQRTYPGALRWALDLGEPVRQIDRQTFEVVATAELLVLIERLPGE